MTSLFQGAEEYRELSLDRERLHNLQEIHDELIDILYPWSLHPDFNLISFVKEMFQAWKKSK